MEYVPEGGRFQHFFHVRRTADFQVSLERALPSSVFQIFQYPVCRCPGREDAAGAFAEGAGVVVVLPQPFGGPFSCHFHKAQGRHAAHHGFHMVISDFLPQDAEKFFFFFLFLPTPTL